MELSIVTLIVAVAALLVGIVAGKFIFAKDTKKKVEEAVKDKVLEQFYVTLTNGTVVKTFKIAISS